MPVFTTMYQNCSRVSMFLTWCLKPKPQNATCGATFFAITMLTFCSSAFLFAWICYGFLFALRFVVFSVVCHFSLKAFLPSTAVHKSISFYVWSIRMEGSCIQTFKYNSNRFPTLLLTVFRSQCRFFWLGKPFSFCASFMNELNWIHNNIHFIRNEAFCKSDNEQLFGGHLKYSSEKYYVKCTIMVANKTSNLSFICSYIRTNGRTVLKLNSQNCHNQGVIIALPFRLHRRDTRGP